MAKSKKAKASRNKAKDVETKKQPKQTSEQLAFALNQNYTTIMQAQANIQAINKELERRQVANSTEKE